MFEQASSWTCSNWKKFVRRTSERIKGSTRLNMMKWAELDPDKTVLRAILDTVKLYQRKKWNVIITGEAQKVAVRAGGVTKRLTVPVHRVPCSSTHFFVNPASSVGEQSNRTLATTHRSAVWIICKHRAWSCRLTSSSDYVFDWRFWTRLAIEVVWYNSEYI